MSTNQTLLREWFQRGVQQGATHMIVVCDTFDHEDYPVYINTDEDARAVATAYDNVNMQRVMEVYSLSMDVDTQMNERRAFHYD